MDIYIVIVVIAFIAAILLHFSRDNSVKKSQVAGLANIVKIKSLISLVQQHRGISSAWLNGDESKLPIFKKMEQKIALICNAINETNIELHNSRWRGVTDP